MKSCRWILLALALLPVAAVRAAEDTGYYAVFLSGKKIGHATHVRRASKDRVVTVDTTELTITRLGIPVTVRQSETAIETTQGKPLGFESVQLLGSMAQTSSGRIAPDGALHVTRPGPGGPKTTVLDWPTDALLPEGLRLLQLKEGLKEGTSYSAKILETQKVQPLELKITVGPLKKVDLLGRVVALTEVTSTLQLPGLGGRITSVSYVDDELTSLKTTTPAIGMKVEMIACDKAFALSRNDVVDFLEKTILRSPVPLKGLREAKSATYYLKPTGQTKLGGMISTDSQTVQSGAKGEVIVTIRPVKAPEGVKFPYVGNDAEALSALKPTAYLQSDNEQVVALARQAVGDEQDAAQAVKRIEAFVGEYVQKKGLSVGYASAVEVAASKEGDCSEHAVLGAAMCRAAGIPARMVVGYVFVPKLGRHSNVFGGHAWVEAYVGGKWVGLDATGGGAGPGHIAQAFGSGDPTDFFGIINTMGSFKIVKVTVEK